MVANAAVLRVVLSGDSKGAEAAISSTEKRLHGLVGNVASFAAGNVVANLIGKVAQGFGDLGSAVTGWESGFANVDSIMQGTAKQLENLKDQALSLATDPGIRQGPAQLAAGLYNIQSSGFDAAHGGLDILEASAKAATAGISTTDTAAAAATAVLNAYGLGAKDVGHTLDSMFQVVADGVIDFDTLAHNLGNVIPIAASLGVSFDEVGAAYAQMTLKGVSGAQAETQIAGLLRAVLNPTQALTEAVQERGYASAEAALADKGMVGFLGLLDDASHGTKQGMFDLLGTQEAMNAAVILGAGDVKDYAAEVKKMQNSSKGAGATQKALERQMKSTSYQVDLLKKNLQIGAIAGLDLFGGSLAGLVHPLVSFTGGLNSVLLYLDDVTEGGNRLQSEFLDKIPDGLQRTARGFGLVVDGVSDTVRAFREGGLDAALDELGRIQGDRILSGFRTVGEEAWGAFSGAVTGAAEKGIDLAVDIVASLLPGGDLATWAGDLWGWVKFKLGGGTASRGTDAGDVTPGFGRGGEIGREPEPLSFGDVVIEAGLKLIGLAKDWAGNLWGFIQDQLGIGGGGPLEGIPIVGNVAASRGADITFHDWTLDIGAPNDVTIDFAAIASAIWNGPLNQPLTIPDATAAQWEQKGHDLGADLGQKLADAVVAGIAGMFGGGDGSGGKAGTATQSQGSELMGAVTSAGGEFVRSFGDAFISGIGNAWIDWLNSTDFGKKLQDASGDPGALAKVIGDALFGDLIDELDGAWDTYSQRVDIAVGNLVSDIEFSFDHALQPLWDFFAGRTTNFPGIAGGVTVHEKGIFEKIGDFFDVDVDLSGLTNPFTAIYGTVSGWVSEFDTLIHGIPEPSIPDFILNPWKWIKDKISGAEQQAEAPSVGSLDAIIGGGLFRGLGVGGSGFNPATQQEESGFPEAEPFHVTQPIDIKVTGPDGQDVASYRNTLVTDIIKQKGGKADAERMTFKATFDADTGPAALAYTDVSTWGAAWDAATFLSTFGIDNGPAAVAYTDAFTWGSIWDGQVFTASFDVDTSGLTNAVAVARQAAADIAAVMPHSPAKEGPLKEPIRFDYIAENMEATASRMRAAARYGAAGVAGALGGAYGPGASGWSSGPREIHVHVHNAVGVDNFKAQVAEAISRADVEASRVYFAGQGQ